MSCPNPQKRKHWTEEAAQRHMDSLERKDGVQLDMNIYKCGNHWHVGHKMSDFELRMKRKLRRRRRRKTDA